MVQLTDIPAPHPATSSLRPLSRWQYRFNRQTAEVVTATKFKSFRRRVYHITHFIRIKRQNKEHTAQLIQLRSGNYCSIKETFNLVRSGRDIW